MEEPSRQRGQCEQGPEVDRAWQGRDAGINGETEAGELAL